MTLFDDPYPKISDMDLSSSRHINSLLTSIAYKRFELANTVNEEADRIQSKLDRLRAKNDNAISSLLRDFQKDDKAAEKVLQDVIKKELLLQSKLESILEIPPVEP